MGAGQREHLEALSGLFGTTVQLCARAGLVELGHVSVDGTKIQANASKHKAMSYDRMQSEDDKLRSEMQALLARAEAVDREEDERFGVGRDAFELPEELKRRETRLARIRQAKAELEAEAKQARAARLRDLAAENDQRTVDAPTAKERAAAATRAKNQRREADELAPPDDDDDDDEPPSSKLPKNRVPALPNGSPKGKAQRNFTDPDSRIMVDGQGPSRRATTRRLRSASRLRSSSRARSPTRRRTSSTSSQCSKRSNGTRAPGRIPSRPTPATGRRPTRGGARNATSTRTSRRGADATALACHHHAPSPARPWRRSSKRPQETPATADAKPRSSRCLVRSRKPGASGASYCADSTKSGPSGPSSARPTTS